MAAVELGNQSRSTLGHMPFAAYGDAAAKGTLLLAYDDEPIVGYALYGLTRHRVRLTHLCVHRDWRGGGIARQMVRFISDRHADYPGILAKCRVDYEVGEMWIKLGFTPIAERPGRSKEGHTLISWWRDHGHPNLFSRNDDDTLLRVAIDLNVLRDLAEHGRPDAEESRALLSDQLADRLEVVRTAALDTEINKMTGTLRPQCIEAARQFTLPMPVDSARLVQIRSDLLATVHATEPGYPRTEQDRRDLAYVTEAIAVGLQVFVTRDEHLTQVLGPIAQREHGLRVLRPVDVVIHIDELTRAEEYRPAELHGTLYRAQMMGVGGETELGQLVNGAQGERPRALRKLVRDLALTGCDRIGIYDPRNHLVAAYSATAKDGTLTVPLLRVDSTSLADTVARQIIFQLRQRALATGLSVIRITDQHMSRPARLAAINDGFYHHDGHLHAFVIDRCGPAAQVEHEAASAARRASVPEPAPLRSAMPGVVAAELERIWWPAKITDSELPTYLVPIRQAFSAELLGVPTGLLPRPDTLGLAREHVYYRSPGGLRMKAPARLLWYMSGTGAGVAYPSAVIACSQLDAVETGEPQELHSRFRHLGVWQERQLHEVARGGQVQALRFTNTELLTHIPRQRLTAIANWHGYRAVPPQGPLRISAELFAELYQEGRRQ
ncbi:GNAT family N-acetyltransferase [Micromonospora aurantiaca (nom. illeg.)]|uniref:GNAT family N-acetyltransferase n=1 Tax=Micromonospora aurantiaca (nom. illeg.) TaxID=47850 RepID=UPI003DA69A55